MSLFKRKKAGEEANTIPEAMDDITQTLLIPVKDEGEKTMCADAYETSQAEIASYTSIGTRKSQQDSICFDFGDFCTVCAVCDGMGGLTGGERASALAAHGVTRYLLEHAQAEDIPTEMGRAALRLNEEVKNLRDPANQKIEAGTTLTTVFLRNGKLFWCSIGDSHIYLYTLVTAIKALKETGNGSMEPAPLIQIGILVSRTIRMVLSTMQCSMKIFRMGHGMMQME